MFLYIKTKLTYIKKDSAAFKTILGISHNCLLMEAFVNNFQQFICPLFTFFGWFWSVFIEKRHKGQKLYQKKPYPCNSVASGQYDNTFKTLLSKIQNGSQNLRGGIRKMKRTILFILMKKNQACNKKDRMIIFHIY